MVFWKRHKSKILIASAVLAIATGALSVIQIEKSRLEKSIVGCNRQVEVLKNEAKKDIPKGLKEKKLGEVKKLEKEGDLLEHKEEEIIDDEFYVQDIIEKIEEFKDWTPSAVNITEERSLIDKYRTIINNIRRIDDATLRNLYEVYPHNPNALFLELVDKLNIDFPSGIVSSPMYYKPASFPIENSESMTPYNFAMDISYNYLLYNVKKKIEYCQRDLTSLNALSELNEKIIKISDRLRERYSKKLDGMNEANEKIDNKMEEIKSLIKYFNSEYSDLIKDMKINGIKIRF